MKLSPRKLIKKIVIIRTDRIGEVLLSTVLVDALKKHYPSAAITFVTSTLARDVIAYKSNIDDIWTFDTANRNMTWNETWQFAMRLRREKFDLAITVNPHKNMHLATLLAGIHIRIGFNRKLPYVLTHAIPDQHHDGMRHEIEYTLELLTPLGIHEEFFRPTLSVPDAPVAAMRELLRTQNVDPRKKLFIVHPGSNFQFKRWSKESFISVMKFISHRRDVNIILTGAENEQPLCDEIAARVPNGVINLAGKLTLKQLIALLKIADLVLCNDSGPMHIAYCLGTKVAAIFGRGTRGAGPTRWAPRGDNVIVFNKPSGCTDCDNELCPYDFRCLKLVKPDEVVAKLIQQL